MLGAYVGVHEGDGGFAGDGDVERVAAAGEAGPLDADLVERVGEEPPDVVRLVGEEVPGVFVALALAGDEAGRPVGDAAAVGVDEAADELPGVRVDDGLLPGVEGDEALVLLAGAVLGEQAVPGASSRPSRCCSPILRTRQTRVGREDRAHGLLAFVDEAGPDVGAGDHEVGHPLRGVRD